MQYSFAAIVALVATASASYPLTNQTVVYTTEVHTAYTTVCPAATELTFNGVTYTATEATTLTITNCPCTVVKPVTTTSVVYCNTCTYPTSTPGAPVYANTTTAAGAAVGTSSVIGYPTAAPSTITASGGNKVFAFSGASLAGLLAFAAYVL